ncbi:phosphatidylcholine-sterol acyltransferase [Fusarium bulbicola]|nr:phosphatidylcholine-sterol acyltransferase [Fusarium bulbicola]
MLETYRQEMMPLFPFVWIGLDEAPEKLFQERPMLYMAIMVVTCQENIEIQQELAQKYREEIGRRIWTLTEKNLQLLQGILVFLAWYQTHWVLGLQLSNLMYMAMSLVTELGLDKEPSSGTRTAPGVLTEITKKQEPQPFDQCNAVPGFGKKRGTDLAYAIHGDVTCGETAPLTMSFHLLQVYLYKIGIDERLHEPKDPTLLQASDPSPHALRCSYLLVSCLNAVKAVIDNFLLLTSPTILSMPYTYWIQMGHCINMFSRLLVTHSTLWDPNLVTGIHDFTSTLERLAVKIEGAMSEGAGLYGSLLAHAYPIDHPTKFSRLVVFGDSFSDNGNGSWVVSNGTWPVDPAYYHHSFSNGPKWNDVVAKQLGLELINLATGGATTNNDFVAGGTGAESTIPVPSAADQVLSFLSWDKPQAGDIFVHWIGANDILFNTSITGSQVTSLINENVNRLFQAGAKTIILANYLNATTFPATYNSSAYNVPSVQDYVPALTKGLEQIAAGYSAYAKTAVIDVQDLFNDMFSDPEAYGFDEDYVNPPTACLTGVYTSEGVPRHLCSDPEKHVFFDSYHPVKEVHALVAKLFVESIEGFSA